MKRIFITIGMILLLAGCGVSHDEPKEVAAAFMEAYKDHDVEKIETLVTKRYFSHFKSHKIDSRIHDIEFLDVSNGTNKIIVFFNIKAERKNGEKFFYESKVKMERVPDKGWFVAGSNMYFMT